MTTSLNNLMQWFKNTRDGNVSAKRTLTSLARGTELTFETDSTPHLMLNAPLQAVHENHIIIGLPKLGTHKHRLRKKETLHLILSGEGAPLVGELQVLGRVSIKHPDGLNFMGYKLSMPPCLMETERRGETRTPAEELEQSQQTLEVELHAIDAAVPVRGILVDISATGLKMSSRNALGRVEKSKQMHVRMNLPHPVGTVSALATIIRVNVSKESKQCTIGVRFHEPIEGLKELLAQQRLL